MVEAQLMAVIHDWAGDADGTELLATLRERFAILLAGARNLPFGITRGMIDTDLPSLHPDTIADRNSVRT